MNKRLDANLQDFLDANLQSAKQLLYGTFKRVMKDHSEDDAALIVTAIAWYTMRVTVNTLNILVEPYENLEGHEKGIVKRLVELGTIAAEEDRAYSKRMTDMLKTSVTP
jgi:hypothetical protein